MCAAALHPEYAHERALPMKIEVHRDACCAADDQAGPLVMDMELDGRMPLCDFINLVLESGFLQYSSSHTSMLGYVGAIAIVQVHSPYYSKEKTKYLIESTTPIQEVLASGSIDFRF
jgi:hypothetical protein